MVKVELWDEFSERLRDLEAKELAPDLISPFRALPGLRGFWTMGAFDSAGNATQWPGAAFSLTYNGNPTYSYDGLVPYIDLDGTGDFLSRADGPALDILGTETYVANTAQGLTLGGWFYSTVAGASQGLITKGTGVPAASSYELYRDAANTVTFRVSNGAAYRTQASTIVPGLNTWFFAAGTFEPALEINVWVNGTSRANAVAIPAAINNSGTALNIGAFNGTLLLTGRASLCFLCTAYLSDSIIGALFEQTRGAFGV